MHTDSIHRQQSKGRQDAAFQLGDLPYVLKSTYQFSTPFLYALGILEYWSVGVLE
jgi:hypothetical protein